jgi:excisionase family DNA binding protein
MSDTAPKMPALEERLWKKADVAAYLGMSTSWVEKRTAAGEIPFMRVGGHAIRFDPEKIKAWAEGRGGGKVLDFKR